VGEPVVGQLDLLARPDDVADAPDDGDVVRRLTASGSGGLVAADDGTE